VEAAAPNGEEFGESGLLEAMAMSGRQPERRLSLLRGALEQHLMGQGAHDDMSVLMLDLET
jgi:serine phosphatase RsbU (regulator of sigma subunit)